MKMLNLRVSKVIDTTMFHIRIKYTELMITIDVFEYLPLIDLNYYL